MLYDFYFNLQNYLFLLEYQWISDIFLSHHREIKYKCRCLSFFFVYSHLKKRSFELLQNEVKYRILLVSKSLPFKSLTLVSVCVLTRKKNHYDFSDTRSDEWGEIAHDRSSSTSYYTNAVSPCIPHALPLYPEIK